MARLELAKGISFLKEADNLPKDFDFADYKKTIEAANLVEGYAYKPLKSVKYKIFAEINVNASRLWSVVLALTDLLPATIAGIVGMKGEQPVFLPYSNKETVLNCFSRFNYELCNCGFLEFGFIFGDGNTTDEVFVKNVKYIQFWGNNRSGFEAVMERFGLTRDDSLAFVDQFPRVSTSLQILDPKAIYFSDVIETLRAASSTIN
jgi:hypothetical protein